MRSACRGVARNAPAPNRSRSNREAPTAIISIAQHASPNVIGHREFFLAQLIAKSRLVTIRPSSKRFSIHDMGTPSLVERPLSPPRPPPTSRRVVPRRTPPPHTLNLTPALNLILNLN